MTNPVAHRFGKPPRSPFTLPDERATLRLAWTDPYTPIPWDELCPEAWFVEVGLGDRTRRRYEAVLREVRRRPNTGDDSMRKGLDELLRAGYLGIEVWQRDALGWLAFWFTSHSWPAEAAFFAVDWTRLRWVKVAHVRWDADRVQHEVSPC
jgi:hypothetical protein